MPIYVLASEKSNPQLKHSNGLNVYLVFQTTIIQKNTSEPKQSSLHSHYRKFFYWPEALGIHYPP